MKLHMNLFIIGNGFDLSHYISTSYEHFHQYLKKKYPNANDNQIIIPNSTMMPDGGIEYDDNETVSLLLYLISSAEKNGFKWSDLENTLGILDFGECFDDLEVMYDRDGDRNLWHEAYNNEDRAAELVIPISKITNYFADWINTIKIDENISINSYFKELINIDKDYFLTFNYTTTLEKLYNAKNVCHIHGKKGEKLIFGHGNEEDCYEYNMGKYIGAESSLQDIMLGLKKDTNSALDINKDFFYDISLENIDKIYSYGFSFSKVDMIYIRKICSILPTENVIWFLNDYDDDSYLRKFESLIIESGFHGRFCTYKA